MTQHQHGNHQHHHHSSSGKRGVHKDWRLWVAVALMLGAMGVYVMSMDEEIQPGGAAGERAPAMDAPAAP